ncbi:MAG: hypothetical protein ACRDCT_15220 [Shewanella sp.]
MKLKLDLAWKIVVGNPETGVDYCQSSTFFNAKTGRTFVKKLGGVSSLDFYPCTFDPTHAFYNAIEPHKLKNNFVGKRIPFEGVILGQRKPINIKIHQYPPELIIISVSVSKLEFNGTLDELKEVIRLEKHSELLEFVRIIYSLVYSGGKETKPVQRKLKVYPCIELESDDCDDFVDDKHAVEILTRHNNPKSAIIDNVISKNDDHQLDDNSILIDRQGILARYTTGDVNKNSIKRKVESSCCLFELAIAISYILEKGQYFSLQDEQKKSITKLISTPTIVFTKSVTAYKTWELLLSEFKLPELYNNTAVLFNDEEVIPVDNNGGGWSEGKSLAMGVLSALLIAALSWAGNTMLNKVKDFINKPVKLVKPIDAALLDKNDSKVNFDWEDVDGGNKYILIIEKYNSKENKWMPLVSGGRYVSSISSKSINVNDEGHFQWKVIARDLNERQVAESEWFFFNINAVEVPQEKKSSVEK